MIEVVVNRGQMRALRAMLREIPRDVPKVLTRALNKVAKSTHVRILRKISGEYAVSQRDLKNKNISLKRANYKNLMAIIRIKGRRIQILAFKAKQLKKGVSYKIKKKGGRRVVYAFMESPPGSKQSTTMASGHKGVFKRRGKSRLPIIELFGPSVPAIFQNVQEFAANTFQREIGNKLGKELQIQAGLMLQRKRRIRYSAA